MKNSSSLRLAIAARNMVPVLTTLLLVMLAAVPTRIPALSGITPLLGAMGVFYWSIYRPDLLPAWVAFVIGLLHDILGGAPLGVGALVFLLIQGAAASQRKFFLGTSFAIAWGGFALMAGAGLGLSWLLVSVIYGQATQGQAVLFQMLLTVFSYPVVGRLLARTHYAVLPTD